MCGGCRRGWASTANSLSKLARCGGPDAATHIQYTHTQPQGLGEHSNYHEFCRLLGRLKTNYQLSELVRLDLTCCDLT